MPIEETRFTLRLPQSIFQDVERFSSKKNISLNKTIVLFLKYGFYAEKFFSDSFELPESVQTFTAQTKSKKKR